MNTAKSEQPPPVTLIKRDRWLVWCVLSIVLNFISLILFPMAATDIATPLQLLSCVVPARLGVYTLFAFRTCKERIVGYLSIIPAAFWGFCAGSLGWEHGWRWQW